MTELARTVSFYINGDLPGGHNALLDGLTANPPNVKPTLMQGDKCLLQLYFRQPGVPGADTTAYELADGFTLRLVGKPADDIKTGSVLCEITAFEQGESEAEYYEGTLDLTTQALIDAFGESASDTIDVALDIEYRDAGNTERLTYRADVQICRQVYQGDEATPTPSVSFPLESPGGYVFSVTVSDEGVLSVERVS